MGVAFSPKMRMSKPKGNPHEFYFDVYMGQTDSITQIAIRNMIYQYISYIYTT